MEAYSATKIPSALPVGGSVAVLWKALPKEQFGSPSSIHKYFLAWKRARLFVRL